jgi:hypothetical protein
VGFENCFISELTIAELFYAENSAESKKEQNRQNVNLKLSFGIRIPTATFRIVCKKRKQDLDEGTLIGEFDPRTAIR